MNAPKTISGYIAGFPPDVRKVLQKMRDTIKAAAPGSSEKISYKIPALALNGRYLVYFAGYKKHVSVYPVPAGDAAFQKAIEGYRSGRGTLRFPLDKPIPYGLITKTVRFLVVERAAKPKAKLKKPKAPVRH